MTNNQPTARFALFPAVLHSASTTGIPCMWFNHCTVKPRHQPTRRLQHIQSASITCSWDGAIVLDAVDHVLSACLRVRRLLLLHCCRGPLFKLPEPAVCCPGIWKNSACCQQTKPGELTAQVAAAAWTLVGVGCDGTGERGVWNGNRVRNWPCQPEETGSCARSRSDVQGVVHKW